MEFGKIIEVFIKWRKVFYKIFISSTIIVIIVTFVIPRKYIISATLMPFRTEVRGGTLPSEYMRLLETIPRGFGVIITPADILASFAQNGNVLSKVVREFNLIDSLKAEDMEEAMIKFYKIYSVKVSEEGMVNLTLLYHHPETGKRILERIIEHLEKFITEIYTSFYKKREELLKKRFEKLKTKLKNIEDSLNLIKQKYKTHHIEDEYESMIREYLSLKKTEIEAEINYKTLLAVLKDTLNIDVKRAKKKLTEIRKKLREIEKGGKGKELGFGAGVGLPLEKVPEISLKIMRLWREQEILSELYQILLEELEKTKIEASKTVPFFSVIGKPGYSKRKKVPKRSLVLVGGILLALFFSILGIYIFEFMERIQREERFKKFREFFETISSDLGFRKK